MKKNERKPITHAQCVHYRMGYIDASLVPKLELPMVNNVYWQHFIKLIKRNGG